MLKFFLISSLLLVCATPMASGIGVLAQTPTPSSSQADTNTNLATTNQVIDQVCDFLQAQQSFTVDIDITYDDVLDSGNKVQYSAYQSVSVQKPNRLRSDYVGDERNTRFYYDGTSFTLYAPDLNYYSTKAAPNTLDAVLAQVEEKYGITIPMSNLVASNTCADMKSNVQQTMFIGVDMVNRVPMNHILLIGNDRDYQIWVTKDKQPLLSKAIITYKNLPGAPQYTALLSNWNFNPQIPAETFTFTPPADATKIEFLPVESLPTTGNRNFPQQQ
jgi:hypothetical protein